MKTKGGSVKVAGFRWAGAAAGIKRSGMLDLGLLVADRPVPAAAVFTNNRVKAAPVQLCQKRIAGGKVQAVLVNSGNANACTGRAGYRAALSTTEAVAQALGIASRYVLPASTGVIGAPLPSRRIERAVAPLSKRLTASGWKTFSKAILTTDSGPKVAARTFTIDSRPCTMLGVAKGAGMIHPNMATTLAFVVTDITASSQVLSAALRDACRHTFNTISVDGDTSTNDMILLMASGAASAEPIPMQGPVYRHMVKALTQVLGELATAIVSDGEGAEHTVRIQVNGLSTNAACAKVAQTVARSVLVKTAMHGCDPNWGRFLMAVGNAGVDFNLSDINVRIGHVPVAVAGQGVGKAAESRAARVMQQPTYAIELSMGKGRGKASYLTCDLGHTYVRINADYRS